MQPDLSPHRLDDEVQLLPLSGALQRNIARFVSHSGVPVLEVLYYDYGRLQWLDVHAFGLGTTEYTNVSAARLPYGYDKQDNPVCAAPDDIADWYVGFVFNRHMGYVRWTLSPLGVDYTSGGHTTCTLEEGAYLVGAISPSTLKSAEQ